jgi:hypothetical protein
MSASLASGGKTKGGVCKSVACHGVCAPPVAWCAASRVSLNVVSMSP